MLEFGKAPWRLPGRDINMYIMSTWGWRKAYTGRHMVEKTTKFEAII